MAWRIKRFSNDELRQRFVDMCVEQAEVLGLRLPDPDLRWNDERQARLHPARLRRAVARDQGQRAVQPAADAHRRRGTRGGAWVRDAADAYAKKKRERGGVAVERKGRA